MPKIYTSIVSVTLSITVQADTEAGAVHKVNEVISSIQDVPVYDGCIVVNDKEIIEIINITNQREEIQDGNS